MSTLLVNPPYSEKIYQSKKAPSVQPPIGLAYLAAFLEQEGEKVGILDANAEQLSVEETARRICDSGAKFIGFGAVTPIIPIVYRIAGLVRKDSDAVIFVGGPHVTFMDDVTLNDCQAIDYIVRGEGELVINNLIRTVKVNGDISRVRGITYRKGDSIVKNEPEKLITDINTLPFPARHLLPLDLYRPSPLFDRGYKGKSYARIMTTRGCPTRCIFCVSPHFWGRVRIRSAENVFAEIKHLYDIYDVRHIDFLDDTLTLAPSRMEKICDLMIEHSYKINWTCYSRVDTLSEALVKKMKMAGCSVIQLGVESGNQKIIKRIKKNIRLEDVERVARIVRKNNIKLMADFMIGLPGETEETVIQTIDFAKKIKPNIAAFCITTPLPGTELYWELRREGKIKPGYIWGNMGLHYGSNYSTEYLSSGRLSELYHLAHKKFYLRFKFFGQSFVWLLKNPYDIKNYFYLAKDLLLKRV
ncbi:B12-binding domain-containing radical SAM protein [Patescibacteria group bacterium]|nr:B12-binding domain-containing radical SAM protein [Patescibacteria group bacterium]MBU4511805.1 B12-binding domain-containing radical SAM protein [Patescibacteria group bacterium]MCG2692555.1 B12-binding domain-containing radical SAM protein [Candidatus Parcubacteria bacterium]